MKHVILAASLLVILCSVMLNTGAIRANNLVGDCMGNVTGSGKARNNELLAKSRAKEDWRDKAAAYGSAYAFWLKSNGKQLTCGRTGSLGNRLWTCEAISQPCK